MPKVAEPLFVLVSVCVFEVGLNAVCSEGARKLR